jgi:hypothetical protein
MMPTESAIKTFGIRIAIIWFTHIPVVVVVGVAVVGGVDSERKHYNIYIHADKYIHVPM